MRIRFLRSEREEVEVKERGDDDGVMAPSFSLLSPLSPLSLTFFVERKTRDQASMSRVYRCCRCIVGPGRGSKSPKEDGFD